MSVPMLDINRQNQPLMDEITAAITEVCKSGAFLKGPAVKQLEEDIAAYCGTEHAIGCASGTDALLVALMALDIGPGDEVILPSFTFFATAGSVWRVGATPVFADIVPGTYNLSPEDVERRITPHTKAIMPVHLFGQAADMTALNRIAKKHNLHVIEDAAQAIGATEGGQRVGALGTIGCFSFYPTKNLGGMGDGGIITTNDAELASKMRVLCDHGQEPRYYHHMVGLNSRLDTVQAAAIGVKFRCLDSYAEAREKHALRYNERFKKLGLCDVLGVPGVAQGRRSVWNQYTVRVEDGARDALQQYLAERQIGSAVYYPVPLHLQKCFAELGYKEGDLPHTEQAAREVLSLPVFPELTKAEQTEVIEAVTAFAAEARTNQKRDAA
ncbi:Aminotransferase [Posidoniimonas polymericola]|uniref:Aminotransferase n=1 Tax=Posidoniimonas polymericola TaxID=2528002 RepID=A0A5C5ZDK2_9BACT|nr:DegT/DnrJ/EryC1/StrS family aminotransferase [Posidoniimonas polymericola]TWT85412.1 Aminotransferase [Posidoniimonas polymericola]